jgi:hypothetical protein
LRSEKLRLEGVIGVGEVAVVLGEEIVEGMEMLDVGGDWRA